MGQMMVLRLGRDKNTQTVILTVQQETQITI